MCFQPESERKELDRAVEGASPFRVRVSASPGGRRPMSDLGFAVWKAAFRVSGLLFPLLLALVSALFLGGGWKAVGSGPNSGSRSAAESRAASLLSLNFSPPSWACCAVENAS